MVQSFDLPPTMAHELQIVHTARALADRGHEAVLFPRISRPAEIGHTSCVLARRPSLGVMSTPSGPRAGKLHLFGATLIEEALEEGFPCK